jgi:hypothetical protein
MKKRAIMMGSHRGAHVSTTCPSCGLTYFVQTTEVCRRCKKATPAESAAAAPPENLHSRPKDPRRHEEEAARLERRAGRRRTSSRPRRRAGGRGRAHRHVDGARDPRVACQECEGPPASCTSSSGCRSPSSENAERSALACMVPVISISMVGTSAPKACRTLATVSSIRGATLNRSGSRGRGLP